MIYFTDNFSAIGWLGTILKEKDTAIERKLFKKGQNSFFYAGFFLFPLILLITSFLFHSAEAYPVRQAVACYESSWNRTSR